MEKNCLSNCSGLNLTTCSPVYLETEEINELQVFRKLCFVLYCSYYCRLNMMKMDAFLKDPIFLERTSNINPTSR